MPLHPHWYFVYNTMRVILIREQDEAQPKN